MSAGGARSKWRAGLIVAAVLSAAVIALVFGPVRAQVTSDADFCTTGCHTDKGANHYASKGHAGACQSCHATGTGLGVKLLLARSLGSAHPAPHGAVSPRVCESCHNSLDPNWFRIAETAGHRQHPTGVGAVDCLSCHRSTSHGETSPVSACLDCHTPAPLHDKKKFDEGAHSECLSCHNFSQPRPEEQRVTATTCVRCHREGAKKEGDVVPASAIRAADLHGGVDCKLCHQPHKGAGPRVDRPCKSCHTIQVGLDNRKLPEEHVKCTSCHQQHRPVALAGRDCGKCHEQAKAREGGVRSTALRHDQCASCHRPHTWKADPNGCVACHDDEATLVFTKSPEQHQRCINCHEVHGPPITGAVCGGCHKDKAAKLAPAPAKHRACIGCHTPHAPRTKAPQACAECHKAPLHQLVTMGPPEHVRASCSGCHTLHGAPAATSKTCATCHTDKGKLVSRAPNDAHKTCESCHRPHRFSLAGQPPPCGRCHANIGKSSGAHGGACVKCHTPHGSPAVPTERCAACHKTVNLKPPPGNAPHARCASCHAPHQAARGAAQKCATCHQDKHQVAQAWPAGSPHREACNRCHSPHDVRSAEKCGSCHTKQQATATGGKHQCKQCHSPHQAPAANTSGWWNRCASCHSKQIAASKKHGKCNDCHKPHKFAPPVCTTCHKDIPSKAAHAVKEHAQCTKCHDHHTASFPGRNECLSCHKDRTNHEPQATRCQACHPFK